ncbi:MAG: ankyrin repeat domain-containing protein [Chloroflexi bacterium]|nr:ankyrin repeat domain-containing protein [Chloroflexota bacterium]
MTPSPSIETVREFVIAGHGNLDKVKLLLSTSPSLLNLSYEWKLDDSETALQAAAHMGSRAVAEYLLAQGAPLDICTAAMLGCTEDVEHFLQADPSLIRASGAHRIPLLTHAALSGNIELAAMLMQRGATEGISPALTNAVSQGHVELARWLLEHGKPDLNWKNIQGKTVLDIATERGDSGLIELLRGVVVVGGYPNHVR